MLKAAREVIAEKGLKRATLDEIAQRAEFGKGTIYNYFPEGKDEMLFAILDDVYGDLHAITKETFGSDDDIPFRDRLTRYVESFLSYFIHQRDLFVILMKEANRLAFGDEESKAVYFKHHLDRFVAVMEPVIARSIALGSLQPYPPEPVAHMILGNMHGYLRYNCFRGISDVNGKSEAEIDARKGAEFLCGVLLDGLATTPSMPTNLKEHAAGEEAS